MVIGSGLIARAFVRGGANALAGACFYAAGVSNSGCRDEREFQRERARLDAALAGCPADTRLVYFSSSTIGDPSLQHSDYVQHKLRMEERVRARNVSRYGTGRRATSSMWRISCASRWT